MRELGLHEWGKQKNIKNIHIKYIFSYFSRATLNETFTAKYDGVLPRTP